MSNSYKKRLSRSKICNIILVENGEKMGVVDIIILILLFLYIAKGFHSGLIKELVTFVGGALVIIVAFLLKNPLSVYLYENLPFFKFTGDLAGISVLNVIVYELIAFLVVATVLLVVYKLVIKLTNVVETILKITVILEIPSKILGALVGLIEGVFVAFILLFISMQFDFTREYVSESKYGNMILTKTPILGNAISPVYDSLTEIYEVAENYKNSEDKTKANYESLEILLKYKVLDAENAQVLYDNKKLEIPGMEELIEKYRVKENR